MKTLTLFLLLFTAYSMTNNNTAYDILSTRFQHFYDPETNSFNNLNDDVTDYTWHESNEEGIITSIIDYPLEENALDAERDDQSETDLHNVLMQILKESSYKNEAGNFFLNHLKPDQQRTLPLKTKEGYIDLFDLLIFGSLRSRTVHGDTLNEEESNEEGIFHTVAHNNGELVVDEEENFETDDDEEDDQAFIELLLSNKHLNGELVMDMILDMMKKSTNDVDDDDDEEEDVLLEDEIIQLPVVALVEPEEREEDGKFLSQIERKEGAEMDQAFSSVFDF